MIKNKLFLLVFLFTSTVAQAQDITVTGTVSDAKTDAPLPGVTIVEKGTTNGTTTNALGEYSLILSQQDNLLVFTSVGYLKKSILIDGRTTINVQLESSLNNLNELVVTGYMKQKKADLTGAVTVVSAKELERNHGSTNILTALQGKVPGMHISTDGNPTQKRLGVRIRGLTSVNAAPPLVVIDGVPAPGFSFRDLNAGNIASIQVLRDAYSASIYGAQGAGGVILVETKKGKPGKATIRYQGTVGGAAWLNRIDMLNTKQYGQALWQAAVNDGKDPNKITQIYTYQWHKNNKGIPILDDVTPIEWLNAEHTMPSANTDWWKEISRLGFQTNHQITVSGGSPKATSLLSVNYFENQGFIIHTGYKRYSIRLNTNYKVINDHFNIGENIAVSRINMSTQDDHGTIHNAMIEPPIIPVHTTDGGWGGTAVGLGMDDYWNPVRILVMDKDNRDKFNKVIGDVYANIYFLKHFTFHSQLGLIYTEGSHRTINFKFHEGGGKVNEINSVDQWYWWEANLDFTNTLDYKLSFGKSKINALIGIEANKYSTETTDASRQDLQFEDYNYAYLSTGTGNMAVSGGGNKYTFLSYFGKVNYVYDAKYLLSGSVRYDGSSKFGINNQFGLFPALSAGWRLSNEDFIKNIPSISNLKLRVSWGVNGNSNIPTGATATYYVSDYNGTSYAIAGNETGNNPSGYRRVRTGNPNLKWETSKQTDIGIDFGFFNQRLTGAIDYYQKSTKDMLFQPPYLGAIGEGGYQYVNAADMSDKGIELVLSYQSKPGKDFNWTISGNISHNKNEITNLPTNVKLAYGGSALKGDDIQGRPIHSYYGFIAEGLYNSQEEVDNSPDQAGKGLGRIRYKDISGPDGMPDGKVDYDYDQTWIGSWDPKVEFGLSFSANYKNFDFYMFWQGVAGNTVYNGWKTYSDFWNIWVQKGFNHPVRILDAWSLSNPNSTIPALSLNASKTNNELRMSTYLLESGDYLKLRNVQIGYTLPSQLISKLGMKKFRFYIMAQNLITIKKTWGGNPFTGPDPETPNAGSYNNEYVIPQIFKTGIDVTF